MAACTAKVAVAVTSPDYTWRTCAEQLAENNSLPQHCFCRALMAGIRTITSAQSQHPHMIQMATQTTSVKLSSGTSSPSMRVLQRHSPPGMLMSQQKTLGWMALKGGQGGPLVGHLTTVVVDATVWVCTPDMAGCNGGSSGACMRDTMRDPTAVSSGAC